MSALVTLLRLFVSDSQGHKATVEFGVVPAAFGDTTLPDGAEIETLAAAIFATANLSDAKLDSYEVAVRETAPSTTGGAGSVNLTQAARFRNEITSKNWETRIPGLLLDHVLIDPQNKSTFSVTSSIINNIRTAMQAVTLKCGDPKDYADPTGSGTLQVGSIYDGKRSAPRPK